LSGKERGRLKEKIKVNIDRSIVLEIYRRYYLSNNTPENLVSSHWKIFHKMINPPASFDGEVEALLGVGFGDIQNKSRIQQLFDWMTIASYLLWLKNRLELIKLLRIAIPLAHRMGFRFSYDCFRQVCSLYLIMTKIKKKKGVKIINIGDGYGFLSALIKEVLPDSLICMVDLGKTLLFQAYYCEKAHPGCPHKIVLDSLLNGQEAGFCYCPAEFLSSLNGMTFDIAINIASMQEMNTTSVNQYFDFMRKHLSSENLFYCCNREEKVMPGGEISSFYLYPWIEGDTHLIDEYCLWHRYFFGLGTTKNGPKIFNWRIPFVNYFDGLHRHRLTVLCTSK
jgi:hypothetical protein